MFDCIPSRNYFLQTLVQKRSEEQITYLFPMMQTISYGYFEREKTGFLFRLERSYLTHNAWMSVFISQGADSINVLQQCISLFDEAHQTFEGLGGYFNRIDDLPALIIMPRSLYENAWAENIFNSSDIRQLPIQKRKDKEYVRKWFLGRQTKTWISNLNNTEHAEKWLRGIGEQIFVTASQLERLPSSISETLAILAARGCQIRETGKDRWSIQLYQTGSSISGEEYQDWQQFFTPILPEGIATTFEGIAAYLRELHSHEKQRRDTEEAEELLAHPYPQVNWRDLTNPPRVSPTIVLGDVTFSGDYTDHEFCAFYSGTLSVEMRQTIEAYLRSWIQEVGNNANFPFYLKSTTEIRWADASTPDDVYSEIFASGQINSQLGEFTIVGLSLDFTSNGQQGVQSITNMFASSAEHIGVELLCFLVGDYTEGEAFTPFPKNGDPLSL